MGAETAAGSTRLYHNTEKNAMGEENKIVLR